METCAGQGIADYHFPYAYEALQPYLSKETQKYKTAINHPREIDGASPRE
jgi:hypothetical protein